MNNNKKILFKNTTKFIFTSSIIPEFNDQDIFKSLKEQIKKLYPEYYKKVRQCISCGWKLFFDDYIITNLFKESFKKLIKLWMNDKIEFYCCFCYRHTDK